MKSVFEGRLRIDFKAILKTLYYQLLNSLLPCTLQCMEKENLATLWFSENKKSTLELFQIELK